MSIHYTPLRYPGGKSKISDFIGDIILLNNLEGCHFYEMYAGGAGASLNLLFEGICSKITLNDLDRHIYSFWSSIINNTDEFIRLISDTNVSINQWRIQSEIYKNEHNYNELDVGFATFFLNRCNRSGIIHKAGPIGGFSQLGNYKIDVRFNKPNLIKKIELIASMRNKIELHSIESISFLKTIFSKKDNNYFIFLDPPYYNQGENLYFNFYNSNNHIELSELLKQENDKNWYLTYDNTTEINDLYSTFRKGHLPMSYTLQTKKKAKEVMIFADKLTIPQNLRLNKKSSILSLYINNEPHKAITA